MSTIESSEVVLVCLGVASQPSDQKSVERCTELFH